MRTYTLATLAIVLLSYPSPMQAQWVPTSGPSSVGSFGVSGTNLFAGTLGDSVFLSTNNGTNWTSVGLGPGVAAFAVSGSNIFAGTYGGRVYLSTNNGTSWTAASTGLTTTRVWSLAVSGTNLFAGTYDGIFMSTNNGTSWTQTGLTNTYVSSLAVSGANLFAGTDGGVFISTDTGTSWAAVNTGLTDIYVNVLAVSGANLFAGTHGGAVFLSTDNGTKWTATSFARADSRISAFAVFGSSLFVGGNYGGQCGSFVYLSTDNGTSWTNETTMIGSCLATIAVSGSNLFAGTAPNVWRRPLSEMIPTTSVADHSIDLPSHFSLSQNYPNPFNPSTVIRYGLPAKSMVMLSVYSTLGQRVAILINEIQDVGYHEAKFDGSGLASGVYFYRLQAGGFVHTKKLLLLR